VLICESLEILNTRVVMLVPQTWSSSSITWRGKRTMFMKKPQQANCFNKLLESYSWLRNYFSIQDGKVGKIDLINTVPRGRTRSFFTLFPSFFLWSQFRSLSFALHCTMRDQQAGQPRKNTVISFEMEFTSLLLLLLARQRSHRWAGRIGRKEAAPRGKNKRWHPWEKEIEELLSLHF
jgi:hypothetical protein